MFVETKREGEVTIPSKPQPSLSGLISWLETQRPNQTYSYMNCQGGCLVGLYYQAIGYDWYDDCMPCHPTFSGLNAVAATRPHTFGAALDRARACRDK